MKKQPPAVPCPKCHAAAGQPCKNYKGQNCAPHAGRTAAPTPAAKETAEETARTLLPIEASRIASAVRALQTAGSPIFATAWAHGRYAAIGSRCSLQKLYVGPYRTRDELQKDLPRLQHLIQEGCP
jgi:hypothetical protein